MDNNGSMLSSLDHQRWLINNGFISDIHKDNLYMYGAIASKYVTAVEIEVQPDQKLVSYRLYVTHGMFDAMEKYRSLVNSRSIIDLWRVRRILRKFGDVNLGKIVSSFVSDYCGPSWKTDIAILRESDYVDGYDDAHGRVDSNRKQPST